MVSALSGEHKLWGDSHRKGAGKCVGNFELRVSKINPLTLSSLLPLLERYKCLLFLPNKHFLRYTYNKTKHMNTGDHLRTPILSRCSKGKRKSRVRDVTITRFSHSRARKFPISPSLRHPRSQIHF